MLMEPEPGNPLEAEGVLNPAAVRAPDGELYIFPRLTAKGNYSRIGISRVCFNDDGDPTGVERLGVVLEPKADYEKRPDGGGGCEDRNWRFFIGHSFPELDQKKRPVTLRHVNRISIRKVSGSPIALCRSKARSQSGSPSLPLIIASLPL
jgi:hypothetical protein